MIFYSDAPHTQVVKDNTLVLFMKGTPDLPQCGFSRAVVQILEVQGVEPSKIKSFNCLEDQELREGIKEYRLVESTKLENANHDGVHSLIIDQIISQTHPAHGLRSRKFISRASLSVDATSCCRCTKVAS